ncbi:MAG: phospho-sugar mutase [Bacteroidetes bacterium]|nr:MAG: phospho-sugar mutase [Bacteroidota bacterium]
MLTQEVQLKVNQWLSGGYDDATKKEIQHLIDTKNETELTDSFYKDLEFGTGGLRGIMGVGSNKMNKYTVGAATQGIFNYLQKSFAGEQIKVAIAYDSRNNSPFFAQITAQVFAANGAKVYLFEELRPTPELSFAIRHLCCHSGVVITASHNPKEYNGYKAYWNDGAQMLSPHDTNSILEVQKIKAVSDIKFTGNEANIIKIGNEIDAEYLAKVASLSVSKEAIKRQKDLKIVFTPLHGTGITLVPELLKKFGFENTQIVESQAIPDGNFPTTPSPNPEEKAALEMAVNQAKAIDADLVLATDPDADRVGIAIKDLKGNWTLVNGNQTGSLLIYYMLNAWKEAGKIDGKQFICKTIVTSYIMDAIAAKFGVKCYNVLTGFKYIGEIIRQTEGKEKFIVGGEESYGYLIGDFSRDKDAVASCAFIAEMAAYAKDKGRTLFDFLVDMYVEFGFYKEKLKSITKPGKSGQDEIKAMMVSYRNNPPKTLAGSQVVKLMDYEMRVETDLLTGKTTPIALPKSDVLQFLTADGSLISARPSGTEPKIKFYFSVNEKLESKEQFDLIDKKLDAKIDIIITDLGL